MKNNIIEYMCNLQIEHATGIVSGQHMAVSEFYFKMRGAKFWNEESSASMWSVGK